MWNGAQATPLEEARYAYIELWRNENFWPLQWFAHCYVTITILHNLRTDSFG